MNEDFSEEDIIKFLTSLSKGELTGIRHVMEQLAAEITETQQDGHDVLFCGSNGAFIVKCLHYDKDVLGFYGPTQLPSANDFVLLFACSNEFLDDRIAEIKEMFDDPEEQSQQWENYLNALAAELGQVSVRMPGYDKLLENE